MRLFFVLCFLCCSLVVAAPVATDEEIVVPLAARLTDAGDIRPVRIVIRSSPRPTPSASPTLQATARPVVRPIAVQPSILPSSTPKPTPVPTPTPKPTPEPTPTPTPTASSPSSTRSYSREEVKAGIRSAWGGDDEEAIRVADCESGLNPRASSPGGHYGLWQMRMETWHTYGGSGDPRDASPAAQTQAAYRLYQQRGWAPWSGCAS